jgi:Na+-translocating ferredoxin:NAD+ oxidoreductase RNF subunit RnfB
MGRMKDFCDINCDICFMWIPTNCTTLKEARKILKKEGWPTKKIDNKVIDICPNCKDKEYEH